MGIRRRSSLQGWLDPGPHPVTACFSLLPRIQSTLPPQSRTVSKTSLCNSFQRNRKEGYLLKPTQKRGKPFLEALPPPPQVSPHLWLATVGSHPLSDHHLRRARGNSKTREARPWLQGGSADSRACEPPGKASQQESAGPWGWTWMLISNQVSCQFHRSCLGLTACQNSTGHL